MAKSDICHHPSVDANWASLVKHKDAWLPLCMFPTDQQFEAIRNFPLNDKDILVASFPKSGCTVMHEVSKIVSQIELI